MPTSNFLGKTYIQNHHFAVPHRQLVLKPELSLFAKGGTVTATTNFVPATTDNHNAPVFIGSSVEYDVYLYYKADLV
jgi:hypothetical protein